MTDLNIPNLNKKSDKYLFKNKLTQTRKSKGKLLRESFFMISLAILIVYLNYLIPDKSLLFKSFLGNIKESLGLILELVSKFYQIFLIVLIILSLAFALILLVGSITRLIKFFKKRSKKFNYM